MTSTFIYLPKRTEYCRRIKARFLVVSHHIARISQSQTLDLQVLST